MWRLRSTISAWTHGRAGTAALAGDPAFLKARTHTPSALPPTPQAYFISKQHRRALMVLCQDDMHTRELRFRHLAACCLAECKEWEECLSMLGEEDHEAHEAGRVRQGRWVCGRAEAAATALGCL